MNIINYLDREIKTNKVFEEIMRTTLYSINRLKDYMWMKHYRPSNDIWSTHYQSIGEGTNTIFMKACIKTIENYDNEDRVLLVENTSLTSNEAIKLLREYIVIDTLSDEG